jgi:hypothetical protein
VSGAAGLSASGQTPAAPASQGAAQSTDPKTALVMGQVVDADTGQPVPGAVVRLVARSGATPPPARSGQPNPFAATQQLLQLTDNEGRFLFHDLPKGAAVLSATATGYMTPVGPGAGGGATARPLTLAEGEHVFDHKIRLVRFATISGTVVDEAGEPAVNFPIEAVKRPSPGVSAPPGSNSYSATTDDRGVFRISQIPPGDYFVVAPQTQMTMPAQAGDDLLSGLMSGGMGGALGDMMASGGPNVMGALGGVRVGNLMWSSGSSGVGGNGFSGGIAGPPGAHLPGPPPPASGRLQAYQTTFYPAALSTNGATVITLRSGEDRDAIDFQLRPVVTSRVSGSVTGPTGPMKSIQVRLVPAGMEASNEAAFDVATAMTASDGTFTMLGVPAGQYVAKVEKPATPDFGALLADMPEMANAIPAGLAAFMPKGSKESLSAEAPVGVGDGDTTGVTLVMVAGAHIAGHVEFEGTAAKPAPQTLTVTVQSAGGGVSMSSLASEKLSATGEFKTSGAPPGRYNLSIMPSIGAMSPSSNMLNWMVKSITAGGRDVTNDAIDLKSTDVSDVVVTFTDQISNITGTVKAPSTGGFEGVSVVYVPADYQKWFLSGGMTRRSPIAVPDSKGAFTINRVAPGEYLIIAVDNGVLEATPTADFYDRLARAASRVTVGLGEKKTVTLDVTKVIR